MLSYHFLFFLITLTLEMNQIQKQSEKIFPIFDKGFFETIFVNFFFCKMFFDSIFGFFVVEIALTPEMDQIQKKSKIFFFKFEIGIFATLK